MVGEAVGILVAAHFGEEKGLHLGELGGVRGVAGEVGLQRFLGGVLGQEFVGVGGEVEELGLVHAAIGRFVADEFPVALFDAAHAGFAAAAVSAVEGVADGGFFAHEHGFEAGAFVGVRRGDAGEIAEGGEDVEEVDVALHATAGGDAGAFDDEGHTPGVLVEVLFAHEAMATNRDAVVGGVEDVGVVELAHGFELLEDAADLNVDVLTASELATELVADAGFVAPLPDTAHGDFIAHVGVGVVKGVGGEVVGGQGRLQGVQGRRRGLVGVIGGAVLGEQLGLAVAGVVRMREAEVDEEGIGGFGRGAFREVVHDAVAMPGTAGLVIATAFGGVVTDGEEPVGGLVAVAHFAGAHGGVTSAIEDSGQGVLLELRGTGFGPPRRDGQVPDGAPAHDHVSGGRAHGAAGGAHVVSAFKDHALGGEAIEVGRVQGGSRIINLEVEGRLVIDEDEEQVRAAGLGGVAGQGEGAGEENGQEELHGSGANASTRAVLSGFARPALVIDGHACGELREVETEEGGGLFVAEAQVGWAVERGAVGQVERVRIELRRRAHVGRVGLDEQAVERHALEDLQLGAFALVKKVGRDREVSAAFDKAWHHLRRTAVGVKQETARRQGGRSAQQFVQPTKGAQAMHGERAIEAGGEIELAEEGLALSVEVRVFHPTIETGFANEGGGELVQEALEGEVPMLGALAHVPGVQAKGGSHPGVLAGQSGDR